MKSLITAALPLLAITSMIGVSHADDAALAAKGKGLFRQCAACHTVDEGGRNLVGPNLWGVYGREAATVDGFNYSDAMKQAGLTWDDENLDGYLKQPQAKIPRNRMAFAGLRNPADRKAMIAYLKTLKGGDAVETAPAESEAAQ